jgi:phosphatidylserine/phosphatidylglycerophosphate/cardiolipin synthase-like enzyme|tara:strand:- start:1169 stop:1372 length:204 start_codon:yes stop_codon:yes gene_type:complete
MDYLVALKMTYEAEIATATANLENYLYNSVGVAEHPDIIKSMDAMVEKIAAAKEKILVVEEKLDERS